MLSKPSQHQLEAFAALQGNPNFQLLVNYLSESREALRKDAEMQGNQTLLHWGQGACQVLSKLLHYASNAQDIIYSSRQ